MNSVEYALPIVEKLYIAMPVEQRAGTGVRADHESGQDKQPEHIALRLAKGQGDDRQLVAHLAKFQDLQKGQGKVESERVLFHRENPQG